MKHIILGGDSFSSEKNSWGNVIANEMNGMLWSHAIPSAGNDYIFRSLQYGIHQALKQGTNSQDVIVAVMWTYPSRKSFFISKQETPLWEELLAIHNDYVKNPTCFIEQQKYVQTHYLNQKLNTSGWVIGESNFYAKTPITKFRKPYYELYYTHEGAYIETLEYIVNLQNLCKANNITLINTFYDDVFFYDNNEHIKDKYSRTCKHLYDMIDWSTWVFPGFRTFAKNNNFSFLDNVHPGQEAQEHFAKLVIKTRGL